MADKGNKVFECNISPTICSFEKCCINNRFNNDMLLQIMCCLPLKSVMACKLVCKRWLSIISSQGFVICFISRHNQLQNCIVMKIQGRYCLLSSQLPYPDISFSFLPSRAYAFEILASSNDLLLFSASEELDGNTTTIYLICNPFNKGHVELPPPPPTTSGHSFGFTCEPYYKVNGDRECVMVNSSCRFRVVRLKSLEEGLIKEPPFMIELDIFSSETWQWTTTMMLYPFKIQPACSTSHNGLLYWMPYGGGVVVHDPYNNKVCNAIDPPSQDGLSTSFFCFDVSSEGSLLAFRTPESDLWDFRVWELENLDQPEWRLKSTAALREHLLNTCELFNRAWESGLLPLAFDPNDKNVIFFYSPKVGIATINLMTRLFKPRRLSPIRSPAINHTRIIIPVIPYVIKAPCWPTPISALLNHSPAEK